MNQISFLNRGYAFKGLLAVSLLKNEAQDGYIVVTRMIDETKIVKKKKKKNLRQYSLTTVVNTLQLLFLFNVDTLFYCKLINFTKTEIKTSFLSK